MQSGLLPSLFLLFRRKQYFTGKLLSQPPIHFFYYTLDRFQIALKDFRHVDLFLFQFAFAQVENAVNRAAVDSKKRSNSIDYITLVLRRLLSLLRIRVPD